MRLHQFFLFQHFSNFVKYNLIKKKVPLKIVSGGDFFSIDILQWKKYQKNKIYIF